MKGSAVNPILREGNYDRRTLLLVKNYACKYPHCMGEWSASSQSHVAHMRDGDFYGSDKSVLIERDGNVSITLVGRDGTKQVLKAKTAVNASEIIDAAVMSKKALSSFIAQQITDAKRQGVLLSLYLTATIMKVSDLIMFGIVVFEFYKEVLARYNYKLETLGFDANSGIGDLYTKIKELPAAEQMEITQAIEALYAERPVLAMVNSDKGITNLQVFSDVIVDASMPAMIRDTGKCGDQLANHMILRLLFQTTAMPAHTRR